jgi:hypothetical protein
VSDNLTVADLALLRAARAWGGSSPETLIAERFGEAWRARLETGWKLVRTEMSSVSTERLLAEHRASARPDFARIHPTWVVRALRNESPAVIRAVAAHVPGPMAGRIRAEFHLSAADLETDHPPDLESLRSALALWSERLVGDTPTRHDDPLVIRAVTSFGSRDLVRLVKVVGLAKHAYALESPKDVDGKLAGIRVTPLDRVRLAYFRRQMGPVDPRLIAAARADLSAVGHDHRYGHERLGLFTLGRLLESCEVHRSRWAVQHLPYPVVLRLRNHPATTLSATTAARWENWNLEVAWTRLVGEHRLAEPIRHGGGRRG